MNLTRYISDLISLKSSAIFVGLFFMSFTYAKEYKVLQPSDSLSTCRINALHATYLVGGSGSLTGLAYAWYRESEQSRFHFFNDLDEWRGMDKFGHIYSAFQLTKYAKKTWEWAGYSSKKATVLSLIYAQSYMTMIEVLDGFSAQWGASIPDVLANFTGSALLLWSAQQQHLGFNMKLSFKPSGLAQYRPSLLGKNTMEQVLKDYNAQNYWFSLYDKQRKYFPKFIGIAFAYGAYGMTGGSGNALLNEQGNEVPQMKRLSRFSFSLDIQTNQIHTKYKGLNLFLDLFSVLKFPFPAVAYYSNGHFKFYPYL